MGAAKTETSEENGGKGGENCGVKFPRPRINGSGARPRDRPPCPLKVQNKKLVVKRRRMTSWEYFESVEL